MQSKRSSNYQSILNQSSSSEVTEGSITVDKLKAANPFIFFGSTSLPMLGGYKLQETKVTDLYIDDETINPDKIVGLQGKLTDLDFMKNVFSTPIDSTTKVKLSRVLVDTNLDMGDFYAQMNGFATSSNQLVPYKQVVNVVKYMHAPDYFDVKVSELLLNEKLIISPYDNLGTSYQFQSTNYQITRPNITVQGFKKSNISQYVLIGSSSNTLTVGNATNCYGVTFSDIQFKCNIVSNVFLNANFDTCQFDENVIINSCNAPYLSGSNVNGVFIMFLNCTFNKAVTINSGFNGAILTIAGTPTVVPAYCFFINCSFSGTVTNNSGAYSAVIIEAGNKLPTFSISRVNFVGICKTATDSRIYLNTKSPYDSLTNTRYLWTSSDLAANCNILGSQLSSSAGLVNGQISNLNLSKIVIDQILNMGNFAVTTTKTTFNSNELITKAFADSNYSGSILNNANSWTNSNKFTLPDNNSQNFFIDRSGSTLTNTKYMEVVNKKLYINSFSGTVTGYGNNTIGEVYLGYATTGTTRIGGNGTVEINALDFQVINRQNQQRLFISPVNDENFQVITRYGSQFSLSTQGTISAGMRFRTARFSDGGSLDLFAVYEGANRLSCTVSTSCNTNLCANVDNATLNLCSNGNNNIVNIANGTNSEVRIGSSSSGNVRIRSNGEIRIGNIELNGLWLEAAFGIGCVNLTFNKTCFIDANVGALIFLSTLQIKTNIRNKSEEYIWNSTSAVKAYYQKLLNIPVITYNEIINGNVCPLINMSSSWEYLYDNYNHATHYVHRTDDPDKKPASYFDRSCYEKERFVNFQSLTMYIILAIQENEKFFNRPLKEEHDLMKAEINTLKQENQTLKNRVDQLIELLKSSNVIPGNF